MRRRRVLNVKTEESQSPKARVRCAAVRGYWCGYFDFATPGRGRGANGIKKPGPFVENPKRGRRNDRPTNSYLRSIVVLGRADTFSLSLDRLLIERLK